jgi:excisionase family DNA binding protein
MATELVSVRDAAEQTGQTEAKSRRLIREEKLRVTRVGYHILIPQNELRKLRPTTSKEN